jgi:hypothetical protein
MCFILSERRNCSKGDTGHYCGNSAAVSRKKYISISTALTAKPMVKAEYMTAYYGL